MQGAEKVGALAQTLGQYAKANIKNVTPQFVSSLYDSFSKRYGKLLADQVFKNPAFYGALGQRVIDGEVKRGQTDSVQ
jgi:hypothetical protein